MNRSKRPLSLSRVLVVASPAIAVSLAAAYAVSACNLSEDRSYYYGPSSSGAGPTGPAPDYGPTVTQDVPPPPIAGGTLLAGRRGLPALVADPDRHRLYLVDAARGTSREVVLPEGDEPGRAVHDAAGRAHVAMRVSGDLVTVDLATATIALRRSACVAARGVAFDPTTNDVVVACAEGSLARFSADGGALKARIATERDVRDVWIAKDVMYVSRFRSAEILTYDRAGRLVRTRPMPGANVAWRMTSFSVPDTTAPSEDAGAPAVAPEAGCEHERTPSAPDGGVFADVDGGVVEGTSDPMAMDDACDDVVTAPPELPPDVPIVVDQVPQDPANTGSVVGYYAGGSSPCTASSVVATRVELLAGGSVLLRDAVLPVDVATNGRHVAVAAAGHGHTRELAQLFVLDGRGLLPASTTLPEASSSSSSSSSGSFGSSGGSFSGTPCNDILRVALPGQVVAVAFDDRGRLLVQSREPAAVYVMSPDYRTIRRTIRLSDESREDTGHAIFHSNSGGFISCASCHPEGGDDARTWRFDVGLRRTPSLRGTIADTAPYHWSGDLKDVKELVQHTFVTRMSGPQILEPQEHALEGWLTKIPAPKSPTPPSEASRRGESVFQARGCATCHGGPMLTNNETVDVGTGEELQVPSLRGLGWRAPYLHHGCAKTMNDRFTPSCGGTSHGDITNLSATERSDLAAYLDTL